MMGDLGIEIIDVYKRQVFPILIIILMAIYSYNILVESKQIEVIKRQFTSITDCLLYTSGALSP